VVKNIQGLAPNAWIPTIDASPHEAGTAFVAAAHWQDGDYAPYAYMTTDYGQTWKKITGNLPVRGWVHVVRQDPRNPNLLYLGTEFGIFASWDRGARWHSLRNGIPAVPVRDLAIHPRDNDLIIATHGRGFYVLDDLAPLQKLTEAMAADAYVFDPRPAVRYVLWSSDGNLGQKLWTGENPPYGAVVSYYLKADSREPVVFTIADNTGKPVRVLRNGARTGGVNRVVWDLHYDGPAADVEGEQAAAGGRVGGAGGGAGGEAGGGGRGGRGGFGAAGGPFVVPGDYSLSVRLAGREFTKTIKVELDPRATLSTADAVAQREAAFALMGLSQRVNGVIDRTNDLIRQLTSLAENLRRNAPNEKEALAETEGALADLKKLRDEKLLRPLPGLGYRQYPRLREEIQSLYGNVSRPMARPTDPQVLRQGELVTETTQVQQELNTVISGRIAKLNTLLKNLPHVLALGIIM
jgi:hypothetical protein